MKPKLLNLTEIAEMNPDDQQDAIDEVADALVAEGVTEEQLDDLQHLVDQIADLVDQRSKPN